MIPDGCSDHHITPQTIGRRKSGEGAKGTCRLILKKVPEAATCVTRTCIPHWPAFSRIVTPPQDKLGNVVFFVGTTCPTKTSSPMGRQSSCRRRGAISDESPTYLLILTASRALLRCWHQTGTQRSECLRVRSLLQRPFQPSWGWLFIGTLLGLV